MAPPKKKAEKMSLGDFLGDQSLGNWADEMEDMPIASGDSRSTGYERRGMGQAGGFGDRGGIGDRFGGDRFGYPPREQLPLPTKPPYTAHLGNLSFDATESEVSNFFSECQVTSVRIVEDRIERKPKGFGYVEFGSLDGLKKALTLAGTQFQGRNIRISVAEPPKDRADGVTRDINDWTRKGPLPDLPNQRRPSDRGGSFRNYETASDAGSDRGGSRRGPMFEDNKVRDFSNWERKGPLAPAPSAAPPVRDSGRLRGGDGFQERRSSPAWGEGTARSQDGSRPPRRDFSDKPHYEREPTAPEMDNQWRAKMQPDKAVVSPTPTPDASVPPSPAAPPPPATRPRLNLQKRTVDEHHPQEPPSATSDAKASPFGAARPIDTAAREKEIEEKHQLALRQKKEQDDKEREEKRLAKEQEIAARAAQAQAARTASSPPAEPVQANGKDPKPAKEVVNENGTSSSPPPASGKQYEILRRLHEENGEDEDAEKGSVDEPANGNIVDDKAVKPQEVVRDIAQGEPEVKTTTETMEEDGWSMVGKAVRNQRKAGNKVARAAAS